MLELVFATNNLHKIKEVKNITSNFLNILSLEEMGCFEDIPETDETLEGNASLKSWYIYNNYKKNCFADDTGLEVESLNGKPGVYSARYAGPTHDPEMNIKKLLAELKSIPNRKAQFRTVISLILNGKEFFFEGIVKGTILNEKHGEKGFGYDPIFLPNGINKSFAEMDLDEKNLISHRARAIETMTLFLKKL